MADAGGIHRPDGSRHSRVFDVAEDGALSGGGVFATSRDAFFDGLRCDDAGRFRTSARTGIDCYGPDGTCLGRIHLPEMAAKSVLCGPKRNRLFICATPSLSPLMLPVDGAKTF